MLANITFKFYRNPVKEKITMRWPKGALMEERIDNSGKGTAFNIQEDVWEEMI